MNARRCALFLYCCCLLIACMETGDPAFPHELIVEVVVPGIEHLYVSHITPEFSPLPARKIIRTWQVFPYAVEEVGTGFPLVLLDDFTLKFYSDTVTNAPNWDLWNQENMTLEDCESHVFYATNITGGLSMPELFNPGNTLPFYASTNGNLTITIKALQTNR